MLRGLDASRRCSRKVLWQARRSLLNIQKFSSYRPQVFRGPVEVGAWIFTNATSSCRVRSTTAGIRYLGSNSKLNIGSRTARVSVDELNRLLESNPLTSSRSMDFQLPSHKELATILSTHFSMPCDSLEDRRLQIGDAMTLIQRLLAHRHSSLIRPASLHTIMHNCKGIPETAPIVQECMRILIQIKGTQLRQSDFDLAIECLSTPELKSWNSPPANFRPSEWPEYFIRLREHIPVGIKQTHAQLSAVNALTTILSWMRSYSYPHSLLSVHHALGRNNLSDALTHIHTQLLYEVTKVSSAQIQTLVRRLLVMRRSSNGQEGREEDAYALLRQVVYQSLRLIHTQVHKTPTPTLANRQQTQAHLQTQTQTQTQTHRLPMQIMQPSHSLYEIHTVLNICRNVLGENSRATKTQAHAQTQSHMHQLLLQLLRVGVAWDKHTHYTVLGLHPPISSYEFNSKATQSTSRTHTHPHTYKQSLNLTHRDYVEQALREMNGNNFARDTQQSPLGQLVPLYSAMLLCKELKLVQLGVDLLKANLEAAIRDTTQLQRDLFQSSLGGGGVDDDALNIYAHKHTSKHALDDAEMAVEEVVSLPPTHNQIRFLRPPSAATTQVFVHTHELQRAQQWTWKPMIGTDTPSNNPQKKYSISDVLSDELKIVWITLLSDYYRLVAFHNNYHTQQQQQQQQSQIADSNTNKKVIALEDVHAELLKYFDGQELEAIRLFAHMEQSAQAGVVDTLLWKPSVAPATELLDIDTHLRAVYNQLTSPLPQVPIFKGFTQTHLVTAFVNMCRAFGRTDLIQTVIHDALTLQQGSNRNLLPSLTTHIHALTCLLNQQSSQQPAMKMYQDFVKQVLSVNTHQHPPRSAASTQSHKKDAHKKDSHKKSHGDDTNIPRKFQQRMHLDDYIHNVRAHLCVGAIVDTCLRELVVRLQSDMTVTQPSPQQQNSSTSTQQQQQQILRRRYDLFNTHTLAHIETLVTAARAVHIRPHTKSIQALTQMLCQYLAHTQTYTHTHVNLALQLLSVCVSEEAAETNRLLTKPASQLLKLLCDQYDAHTLTNPNKVQAPRMDINYVREYILELVHVLNKSAHGITETPGIGSLLYATLTPHTVATIMQVFNEAHKHVLVCDLFERVCMCVDTDLSKQVTVCRPTLPTQDDETMMIVDGSKYWNDYAFAARKLHLANVAAVAVTEPQACTNRVSHTLRTASACTLTSEFHSDAHNIATLLIVLSKQQQFDACKVLITNYLAHLHQCIHSHANTASTDATRSINMQEVWMVFNAVEDVLAAITTAKQQPHQEPQTHNSNSSNKRYESDVYKLRTKFVEAISLTTKLSSNKLQQAQQHQHQQREQQL